MGKFLTFSILLTLSLTFLILGISFYNIFTKRNKEELYVNNNTTSKISKNFVKDTLKNVEVKKEQENVSGKVRIKSWKVEIFSEHFNPSFLFIKKGKVKWINKDNNRHEIVCVSSSGPLFDVVINPNENWEFYIFQNTTCWDPIVGETKMRMKIIVS